MNFLAHTLFADGNTERIAGQFCGDFVRGSDLSRFAPGIQEGIMRHRRIDAFTDKHPAVKAMHGLFKPPVRRFAAIVTDVVYDHFLAREWSRYSDVALELHVQHVHEALMLHLADLPPELQRFVHFIQKEQVLLSNQTFEGVEVTLRRIAKRSVRFSPLEQAGEQVLLHEVVLAQSFHTFFPELQAKERQNDKVSK